MRNLLPPLYSSKKTLQIFANLTIYPGRGRVGTCPPVPTRVLCIKTAKCFVQFLLPPDSPIILVFRHRVSLLNSDGFTPNGGDF